MRASFELREVFKGLKVFLAIISESAMGIRSWTGSTLKKHFPVHKWLDVDLLVKNAEGLKGMCSGLFKKTDEDDVSDAAKAARVQMVKDIKKNKDWRKRFLGTCFLFLTVMLLVFAYAIYLFIHHAWFVAIFVFFIGLWVLAFMLKEYAHWYMLSHGKKTCGFKELVSSIGFRK